MATITDILISELDRARVPAVGADELVINQLDPASNEFVTRRINWTEVGQSIQDLSGDINFPGVKQILFADGFESTPSITFKNDQSTGIYRPILSAPAIGISAGGYEAIRAVQRGDRTSVGINFYQSTKVPTETLHVLGGSKLEWGPDKILHFKSVVNDVWIDTETSKPIIFATNGKQRGRFSADGNFHIHGSLGTGAMVGTNPTFNYGDDGDLLLSGGPGNVPEWTGPYEFFDNNKQNIVDILVNAPEFIDAIEVDYIIEHLDLLP